jgi:hypothetical protein
MAIDLSAVVEQYLQVRDARDRAKREYEESKRGYEADLLVLAQQLLQVCNDVNSDSIKTEKGLVMRQLKERYTCVDWDSFKRFVQEHEALDLFERRIAQNNFKEFLKENGADGMPPGINVFREFDIVVRKPSK